jgi:predicted methyltransferase
MPRSLLAPALTVLLVVGAASTAAPAAGPNAAGTPPADAAAGGSSASGARTAPYAEALAQRGRSDADRARDARDRPADLLAFAGVAPGMTVADVFGGGGYYTEILAHVVGADGRVLLVNNAPYVSFAGKDYQARFAEGRLSQVRRSVVESCDLGLAPESLDLAMIVMSYHDLYHHDPNGWPRIDADRFLEQIRRAVKPGGAFLIVDHAARVGTGNSAAQDLHRIDEQFAIADIERHGFALEKRWDGLRDAADDRTLVVFDPKVRGRTDRFVHLYRRKS